VRYQPGNLVWLYSPAVSRGSSPKFHRPWKGPYRVVKVLSDVTYRIQLVNCQQGRYDRRRWHRVLVHFNRLKPCYKPNFIQTPEPGTSQPPANTEPLTNEDPSFEDDVWTPLINQPPIPDDHHGDRDQDPQPRGGSVWGGRRRRTVHPPARFQPGTVSAQQRGD